MIIHSSNIVWDAAVVPIKTNLEFTVTLVEI